MQPSSSRVALTVILSVLLVALFLYCTNQLFAQNPQRTFAALLVPYIEKEVVVSAPSGSPHPGILIEVGTDYIVVRDEKYNNRQAIPVSAITVVVLEDRPTISLSR